MRKQKQLPALKQGKEPKIFKNGKKRRQMASLYDRVKNREMKKHGLG